MDIRKFLVAVVTMPGSADRVCGARGRQLAKRQLPKARPTITGDPRHPAPGTFAGRELAPYRVHLPDCSPAPRLPSGMIAESCRGGRLEIVAFHKRFDRSAFNCGKPELDDWLKTKAGQQERANNTRAFLAVDGSTVIGYYATTTYRLGLDEAAEMYGVGKRAYPIPAVLLARLAVDTGFQGSGVGFTRFQDHELHLFMPVKDLLATLADLSG